MMSTGFGGGRGSSRGSSGGRGRGGGRYHGSNSNGYQGNRGGGGRGGGQGGGTDRIKKYRGKVIPCADFTSKGTCKFGDKCHFSHAFKFHVAVDASTVIPSDQQQNQQQQNKGGFYNQQQQSSPPESYAVSSIAIWDQTNPPPGQAPFKIFTGSYDGFWRLWNPTANFQKEFEHYMGPPPQQQQQQQQQSLQPQAQQGSEQQQAPEEPPKVHNIQITNNYMFVAFDAPCAKIPGSISVGMVHAWNLASPQDPPMEFHMETSNEFSPFAHAGGVSSLLVQPDGLAFSGGKDGLIRCWSMIDVPLAAPTTPGAPPPASPAPNGGATKKVFAASKLLAGHAREVTALARATPTDPILWSGSTDGTMRLWDVATGKCQYMITRDTVGANGAPPQPAAGGAQPSTGIGHTGAITSLVTWDFGNNQHFILSSSLDGSIRAWSTKAECMANSLTIDQAAEQLYLQQQQQQQSQFSSPTPSQQQHPPQGVVCMSLHKDLKQNPLLLCGMQFGDICIRTLSQQSPTVPAFTLIATINGSFLSCGHNIGSTDRYYRTAIRSITDGPSQTFYSGGEDGKLCVWQIVGDFNLH